MTPLEYALAYAARGWRVFPVHNMVRGQCSCGRGDQCKSRGKHPRTRNGVKDATTSTDSITDWWTRWPEANIAIETGRASGLFAVDIDQRKNGFTSFDEFEQDRGGPLPETLIALTGGGGRHIFFRYPSDNLPGRNPWMQGVDVKSDGGYVVVEPSNHESGGSYTWLTSMDQPLAQAPLDLLGAIRSGVNDSGKPPLPSAKSILEGVPEGQRDDVLFRWACRLRRQHSTDDDGGRAVIEKLVLEAAASCDPPFAREEALRKIEQAFKMDHDDDVFTWNFTDEGGDPVRHLTDLGNAFRLIDRFGDDLRYVPEWGWLHWTATGWERVSEGYVGALSRNVPDIIRFEADMFNDDPRTRSAFVKWARDSESSGHLSAIPRLATSDVRVMANVQSFDADEHLIACRNGIVDLRTGQLRSFQRTDHVTKNTNVLYDPQASAEVWDKFLYTSTEGDVEMMRYLQLAAGYTLTGSSSLECFMILSGPPASGKSTFLDALHAAMGTYATSTQSDTFMYKRGQTTPKDELARLAGMRLVSVSEVRQGESFNEALIKQLTGGDKVTARFLYRDAFEFTPQMKIWLATNYDPDTRDTAMWRRIKKISFKHSVPPEHRDPRVKQVLRDPEAGGRAVLAWAVQGAIMWYTGGQRLPEPASVLADTAAYRMEQDRFATFINEVLMQSDGVTAINELYGVYDQWSKMSNEFPLRKPQFLAELRSRGLNVLRHEATNMYVVERVGVRPMRLTANGATWS